MTTLLLPRLRLLKLPTHRQPQSVLQVKPDDHSKLVPPLPIPNRTVKRLCADDSASTRVKVGHRQASYAANKHPHQKCWGCLRLETILVYKVCKWDVHFQTLCLPHRDPYDAVAPSVNQFDLSIVTRLIFRKSRDVC